MHELYRGARQLHKKCMKTATLLVPTEEFVRCDTAVDTYIYAIIYDIYMGSMFLCVSYSSDMLLISICLLDVCIDNDAIHWLYSMYGSGVEMRRYNYDDDSEHIGICC